MRHRRRWKPASGSPTCSGARSTASRYPPCWRRTGRGSTLYIRDLRRGGWAARQRDAIRSDGYVVHTLEAALWSVSRTASFEAALVLAVNLGHDADTVGAATGQLAGAIYGLSGIPGR